MSARIAINGFGRIGRLFLKAALQRHPELEIVAVNDLADPAMNALLFKHDSNYGAYAGEVSSTADSLIIDGRTIKVLKERDPAKLPWKDLDIDIVVESTGFFTDATKAKAHRDAGAKKVIISAPAKNEDKTIVLGVNEREYDSDKHNIISNASCTTNGLAPVAKVLNDAFGIEKGFLTTVHSYTNSQKVLDVVSDDPRDARAAAERASRGSSDITSRTFCEFVYEWIVVRKPFSMPNSSFRTFATGARPFVVQDAFEMM